MPLLPVPLGKAALRREGHDVALVSLGVGDAARATEEWYLRFERAFPVADGFLAFGATERRHRVAA